MPGNLLGIVNGIMDRQKGKGSAESSFLQRIGKSAAQAAGSGNVAIIKKIDANAHNIAVTPNGSDTIDGVNAAVDIAIQWSVLRVVDAASGAWDAW